jgi:hypothetical protein
VRAEHKRRVKDDFRNRELIPSSLVSRRINSIARNDAYLSFMPRKVLVYSAVSSIKSRGYDPL